MDGPYLEPAQEIGGSGWGPVPVCFGRTCLCFCAAAVPWLPYSTCCREARCPPGVADYKALQLLAQRHLLCLLVGLLCRHPGRDACRIFSREIELLFACFARCAQSTLLHQGAAHCHSSGITNTPFVQRHVLFLALVTATSLGSLLVASARPSQPIPFTKLRSWDILTVVVLR